MKKKITRTDLKKMFLAGLAIIRDKNHWTRGFYGKDTLGRNIDPFSENAVCWCSMGALAKAAIEQELIELDSNLLNMQFYTPVMNKMLKIFDKYIHPKLPKDYRTPRSLVYYNDFHSHEQIVALWEEVGRDEGWVK